MAKGLPKWAIKEAKRRGAKNIFAYAWTLVKRKKRPSKSRKVTRKKKSNPKRRIKRMARRRKTRRRYSMTIPLAPIAGLAAGLAPAARAAMDGDLELAAARVCYAYTGYNPKEKAWKLDNLKVGLVPLVIGILVHKFVGGPPLNVNRVLARAKVPFIRI